MSSQTAIQVDFWGSDIGLAKPLKPGNAQIYIVELIPVSLVVSQRVSARHRRTNQLSYR